MNPFGSMNPLPNPYLADLKPVIISPEKRNQQSIAAPSTIDSAKKRVFHPVSESPKKSHTATSLKEKSAEKDISIIFSQKNSDQGPVIKLSTGFEAPPKSVGVPSKPFAFVLPGKIADSLAKPDGQPSATTAAPSRVSPDIKAPPLPVTKPFIHTQPDNNTL